MPNTETTTPGHLADAGGQLLHALRGETIRAIEVAANTAGLLLDALEVCHRLQAERGASTFDAALGEGHESSRLAGLRALTDSALDNLLKSVGDCLADGRLPAPRAGCSLALALDNLKELAPMRARADRREVSSGEIFTWFCTKIDRLLEIIMSADAVPVASSGPFLSALGFLAEGKEAAGRERATILRALGTGILRDDERVSLSSWIAKQESLFDSIAHLVGPPGEALFPGGLEALTAPLEKFRRRALAMRQPAAPDRAAAEIWFDLASERIDYLHGLEIAFAGRILETLHKALDDSKAGNPAASLPIGEAGVRLLIVSFPDGSLPETSLPARQEALARPLTTLLADYSRQIRDLQSECQSLRTTLDERNLVERAKRLLIKHRGFSEEEAYRTLRSQAMSRSLKIPEVADILIRSEELWHSDGSTR